MLIPTNILANADDLGYNNAVNNGIMQSFERGYINSTSLMTNMPGFDEAVELIHNNSSIKNIGLHINLGEGKPVTNFKQHGYLDDEGNFDIGKINRPLNILNNEAKEAFAKEIYAQLNKALSGKVPLTHIDSHCHLHTLPCFYKLFLQVAKHHNLKIRLAQTYNEGNYVKFYFRKYINGKFTHANCNYSDNFETVEHFLQYTALSPDTTKITEIMLHPYIDPAGALKDHYDEITLEQWTVFLSKQG